MNQGASPRADPSRPREAHLPAIHEREAHPFRHFLLKIPRPPAGNAGSINPYELQWISSGFSLCSLYNYRGIRDGHVLFLFAFLGASAMGSCSRDPRLPRPHTVPHAPQLFDGMPGQASDSASRPPPCLRQVPAGTYTLAVHPVGQLAWLLQTTVSVPSHNRVVDRHSPIHVCMSLCCASGLAVVACDLWIIGHLLTSCYCLIRSGPFLSRPGVRLPDFMHIQYTSTVGCGHRLVIIIIQVPPYQCYSSFNMLNLVGCLSSGEQHPFSRVEIAWHPGSRAIWIRIAFCSCSTRTRIWCTYVRTPFALVVLRPGLKAAS